MTLSSSLLPVGALSTAAEPAFDSSALATAIRSPRRTIHIVQDHHRARLGVSLEGEVVKPNGKPTYPLLATLPGVYPEWLGDRSFLEVHNVRFAYVAGAMANGIATADMVIAMAHAKMLGFFGAAGLSPQRVEAALQKIASSVPAGSAWGANLINSPHEPELEANVAELFIRHGVKRVSASAYMDLTKPLVRYALSGVREVNGRIERNNYVFAKISRPETAQHFMSPAPTRLLQALAHEGAITAEEAKLGERLAVSEDITVEADSGGHTDNQILTAVFPVVSALRDALVAKFAYARPIRVGAAGGLGTPSAVASAFSLGAAYVLTGSVNQASVEAGLSDQGKKLLSQASMGDVIMAPAADMFEMGVKVQVLKRGTMFGPRAHKLYDAYRNYDSMDAIPTDERLRLEKSVLGLTCDEVWERTKSFWSERDPAEVTRAEKDPKHQMALCFRWYLGLSSRWAIDGDPSRGLDYQIWCGPAMGAFNDWVRGSFLEEPSARSVTQIAYNLLEGAAVVTRAQQLRSFGLPVPQSAFSFECRPLS